MNKPGWFLLGIGVSVCAAAAVGLIVLNGAHGFSAREQPTAIESWLAHHARDAALPPDAKTAKNPVPLTDQVLADARAHYADHCASCHANDGSGDTAMGRNLYPKAPDMRREGTQKMTDGELFYIIQNGVRMSGMPAWGSGSEHDAEDSWKLVHFIRHLPQLTFEEKKEMEQLNPKGPDDRKEEEEEEKFLNGEDTNATPVEHHHHH